MPAQPYIQKSSKPVLSGDFDVVIDIADIIASINSAVQDSTNDALSGETEHLKSSLQSHPDWSHMADKAVVTTSDSGVDYLVDHKDAMPIEYGDPQKNIVATGLLRSIAHSRSEDLSKNLMDSVIHRISL